MIIQTPLHVHIWAYLTPLIRPPFKNAAIFRDEELFIPSLRMTPLFLHYSPAVCVGEVW